jgi:hypothetical protein
MNWNVAVKGVPVEEPGLSAWNSTSSEKTMGAPEEYTHFLVKAFPQVGHW